MENYPPNAESLMSILRTLRSPDGCPWDREQTRESLVRHIDGECGELINAIDRGDSENICEELGDLLMNLLFQIVIAEEKGEFTFADVWEGIISKMIRRHAHVFGDAHAADAGEVALLWEKIKASEHAHDEKKSVMDKVKPSLSVIDRAEKLQKEAAKIGFDWEDAESVVDKIAEETAEVREALASADEKKIDEELGDLLFSVINLIRFRKGSSSSELLRKANIKFEDRFREMEKLFSAVGKNMNDASLEEFDAFWRKVKENRAADE